MSQRRAYRLNYPLTVSHSFVLYLFYTSDTLPLQIIHVLACEERVSSEAPNIHLLSLSGSHFSSFFFFLLLSFSLWFKKKSKQMVKDNKLVLDLNMLGSIGVED